MAKATPVRGLHVRGSVGMNAGPAIRTRAGDVLALAPVPDQVPEPAQLHALRIAVKRLRYTVEIFAGVLADPDAALDALKEMQDILGAIHDADVLAPMLADGSARPGVAALLEETRRERDRLYARFRVRWDPVMDLCSSLTEEPERAAR